MELIEGESLADRIARGPLPLAEVLRYGVEIAEALHRAHRAGVVHRSSALARRGLAWTRHAADCAVTVAVTTHGESVE